MTAGTSSLASKPGDQSAQSESMNARSLAGTTTSASGCWKKNMYQLRLSCTGDKNAWAIAPTRRHGHPHDLGPALRLVDHGAVGGRRAPVVADDDALLVAAEGVVQRQRVAASAPVW